VAQNGEALEDASEALQDDPDVLAVARSARTNPYIG